MRQLVHYLERFDRKERFFLVSLALGNPRFTLSQSFRSSVGEALHLTVRPDAFVAMDYHLDWLYASLRQREYGGERGPHPNVDGIVRGQQEDIDRLVAV